MASQRSNDGSNDAEVDTDSDGDEKTSEAKDSFNVNNEDKYGGTVLHVAARNNDLKEMKLAIRQIINAKDIVGMTAFHIAAKMNNVDMLRFLLESGSGIDVKNNSGCTALYIACENNNIEAMAFLLESRADVNCSTIDGETILHFLAKKMDFEHYNEAWVKLLFECTTNVNAKNKDKETALHVAAKSNSVWMARMLLEVQADVHAVNDRCRTALHLAIAEKNVAIVKLLLDDKSHVGADCDVWKTAVHIAIDQLDIDMLELILTRLFKEDMEISTSALEEGIESQDWVPALHFAVVKDDAEIVKLLLRHGAKIHGKDAYGCTPVFHACSEVTLKLLLLYGADIHSTDNYGHSVLRHVVITERIQVLNLLLELGASPNNPDNDGASLFLSASTRTARDMLVKYGAEVSGEVWMIALSDALSCNDRDMIEEVLQHETDSEGYSAVLADAVVSGSWEWLVEELLSRGANVNAKCGFRRWSALRCAVMMHRLTELNILLEYGADINVQDEDGDTALTYACRDKDAGVKILKQHAIKLQVAGHYVSEKNLQCLKMEDWLVEFKSQCIKEIENMKKEKIGCSNVHFYSFFTKDVEGLANCARNENIVEALESGLYKPKFPIYSAMISRKFEKAKQREVSLKAGRQFFKIVFQHGGPLIKVVLPDSIIQQILSYLSCQDLKTVDVFISSTDI